MQNIPFISVKAKNNYDLGLQIGRKLKGQIRRRLTANKHLYRQLRLKRFSTLVATAEKFLPSTLQYFPNFVTELQGMSQGAGISLGALMVLMCEEELMDITDINVSKCTNVALKTKEGILIGHNEDWLNSYKNNGLYVLKCALGGNRSLSLNYIGSLAGSSCGLNSSGLCFTANSLNPGRFRYGVPIKFQFRAMLDCKTPRQAIYSDLAESSISGNTIFGWRNSRILDVEDFFGHHHIFYGKKFLIHTNHPLDRRDRNHDNTPKDSVKRYERAKAVLHAERRPDLESLKELLADHEAGICAHPRHHARWGSTIASVIMSPKQRWMEVCWSNPCQNRYVRYAL